MSGYNPGDGQALRKVLDDLYRAGEIRQKDFGPDLLLFRVLLNTLHAQSAIISLILGSSDKDLKNSDEFKAASVSHDALRESLESWVQEIIK